MVEKQHFCSKDWTVHTQRKVRCLNGFSFINFVAALNFRKICFLCRCVRFLRNESVFGGEVQSIRHFDSHAQSGHSPYLYIQFGGIF